VVEDGDLPRARQLLQEFLAEGENRAPWRCPACGEPVDGGLLLCWSCGASRPE
jgi:rubrerythrin